MNIHYTLFQDHLEMKLCSIQNHSKMKMYCIHFRNNSQNHLENEYFSLFIRILFKFDSIIITKQFIVHWDKI